MFKKIITFYRTSLPTEPFNGDEKAQKKYYNKLRLSTFMAGTIGYSLYYVCRTSLNVVKKPIIESGILDARQLGIIGSALLISYAIGKFINSFMADHSNIKRFMATGLVLSAIANLSIGILGISKNSGLSITSFSFFVIFVVMWGINGWSQSMGAAPAIIGLSRWFPLKVRGTFYGFFSASHNLGEFLSFIFVGTIVSLFGWQWGFVGSSVAGIIGVIIIIIFLHDTPQSKGLPPEGAFLNDSKTKQRNSVLESQKLVLKNPYVWIIALSSAFMYVTRYGINSWGVFFLQEAKGFTLINATQIISINALFGIIGTVLSGWFSDKYFNGERNMPVLIFGILNTLSLCLFLFSGNIFWLNVLSMVFFGVAIGVLICYLGGLMAVDIVPRSASGAALGIVGIASYIGAGIQDLVSGLLIENNKIMLGTLASPHYQYNFKPAIIFWISASVLSILIASLAWNSKKHEEI